MMLCFSFWLQGAWIAAELWSVLRSVPVPKRLSNEPWAEVSRLVDSFPRFLTYSSILTWATQIKRTSCTTSNQPRHPAHSNWFGAAWQERYCSSISNGRHPELQSSSETWLRYLLKFEVLSLDELVTRSFLFCVPRPMTSGYMNKKALWKLCEKANMAGFKCFASLSWTNPLQKKKKKISCEDLCDLLIIECLSLVYCIEDIVSFQPWTYMTEVCETNESSGLCWSQATTELVTLWEFGHPLLHSTNYQKDFKTVKSLQL